VLPLLAALPALAALLASGCLSQTGVAPVAAPPEVERPLAFAHDDLSALLQTHIDARGRVDYAALAARPAALDAYLARLAATDPQRLPRDAQLAFWINAYNAYTLYLIRERWPTDGILSTITGPFVPGVNSPFSVDFAVVGGRRMSLDDIEHGTIREQFDEPRIHFAVNCAAVSCPPLRPEAYSGDRLHAQLDEQTAAFLNDPERTRIDLARGEVHLTKILDWFKDDFGGSDAAVQRWIAPYVRDADARSALEAAALDVRYQRYDWSLNGQQRP
jgi:hypothetical protein